jgi:hypothetical protein
MKLKAKSNDSSLDFIIELDEHVGYYVYVYDGEFCKFDYLQDSLEQAKQFALRKFNISTEAWQETDE